MCQQRWEVAFTSIDLQNYTSNTASKRVVVDVQNVQNGAHAVRGGGRGGRSRTIKFDLGFMGV